jgi:hypothetical protein
MIYYRCIIYEINDCIIERVYAMRRELSNTSIIDRFIGFWLFCIEKVIMYFDTIFDVRKN